MDVIIETPKGSTAKYDFNPKLGLIELGKLLPVGMTFPFDFGFFPGTIGEDGDPLDVIVISELAAIPGCVIKCRVIGCMQANQREQDGKTIRNDRYLAVPLASLEFAETKTLSDLPLQIREQLELFFINYNKQAGKTFKLLKWINANKAHNLLRNALSVPSEPFNLIQLFIPLSKPSGEKFPERYYISLQRKMEEKFGGVSIYSQSPVSGTWEKDGRREKDALIIYEVMTEHIDIEYWEACRKKLEKQFEQEKILIRRSAIGLL